MNAAVLYAFWVVGTLLALQRKKLAVVFFFALAAIMPNKSDTAHYFAAYETGIYIAESGFNWLQEFTKIFSENRNLTFDLLTLTPVLTALIFFGKARSCVPIFIFSQFGFLACFNGLRQGIAAVLLLAAVINIYDKRLALALLCALVAPLFHASAIFIVVIFMAILLFESAIPVRLRNMIVIGLFAMLAISLPIFSMFLGEYSGYLRPAEIDLGETRVFPPLKWLVILGYVILIHYIIKGQVLTPREGALYRLRNGLLVISVVSVLLFDYVELASRVGFYLYAADALFISFIFNKRRRSIMLAGVYAASTLLSPSIITIMRL